MKGLRFGLAAGIALSVLAGVAAPSLALEPGEAITLRTAMMKSMGAHMGSIKAAIGAGDGKVVAAQANVIAAMAPTLPSVFPKGSGSEAGKTRAKANVWSEWDKFKGGTMTLRTEAVALAKVAATNDKAKMAAQFGQMAKVGCGGCHSSFRAK